MRQVETIVLVADIERTKTFYQAAFGLEILHDWKSMLIFKNRLAFHQADLLFPQPLLGAAIRTNALGAGNLIVYLESADIEQCHRNLAALGITIIHGLMETPWGGGRIFRALDPDGHLIEIGEAKSAE